jgi:putative transcriptional regulator
MFANKLIAIREQAGISQYKLAQLVGVSKQSIWTLERGTNDPSWKTVQLLALALGVKVDEFVDSDLTLPGTSAPRRPAGRPRTKSKRGKPVADGEAAAEAGDPTAKPTKPPKRVAKPIDDAAAEQPTVKPLGNDPPTPAKPRRGQQPGEQA